MGEHVTGYTKRNGVHVSGYERKSHDRITGHDRAEDRKNLRKARRRR